MDLSLSFSSLFRRLMPNNVLLPGGCCLYKVCMCAYVGVCMYFCVCLCACVCVLADCNARVRGRASMQNLRLMFWGLLVETNPQPSGNRTGPVTNHTAMVGSLTNQTPVSGDTVMVESIAKSVQMIVRCSRGKRGRGVETRKRGGGERSRMW